MIRLILETWFTLPLGWRRLLTVLPVAVAGCAAFLAGEWVIVIPGALLSFILLVLPGPSDAEKQGYHF